MCHDEARGSLSSGSDIKTWVFCLSTPLLFPTPLHACLLFSLLSYTRQMHIFEPSIGTIKLHPAWVFLKQIKECSPDQMRLSEQFKYHQSSMLLSKSTDHKTSPEERVMCAGPSREAVFQLHPVYLEAHSADELRNSQAYFDYMQFLPPRRLQNPNLVC